MLFQTSKATKVSSCFLESYEDIVLLLSDKYPIACRCIEDLCTEEERAFRRREKDKWKEV